MIRRVECRPPDHTFAPGGTVCHCGDLEKRNGQFVSRKPAPWSDAPSTPPETPYAIRQRWRDRSNPRRESFLPPRTWPATTGAAAFISAAGVASFEIDDPMRRALVMALCGFLSWLVGYVTPPPRRSFRRDDP